MSSSLESLTAVFRSLGARHPEAWARSQVEEGIPQLSRFLFLKLAWGTVIPESDAWMGPMLQTPADSNDPYSGGSHALRRLLAAGVSRGDLTDLVRSMQAQMLFALTMLLDDPPLDAVPKGARQAVWGLFRVDAKTGAPLEPIGGLHESVLDVEPSGREMRPR
jgi:hypothetical protein